MYQDSSFAVLSQESNELWREHTARYLANRFHLAYTSGDYDVAVSMETSSGVIENFDPVIKAFGTEVSDVACETLTLGVSVRCTATQTDDFTRYINGYTYPHHGVITISQGKVSGMQPDIVDPVFGQYVAWLDAENPESWGTLSCVNNGWASRVACVPIMLDPTNLDAWLASGPDLSTIGL